MARPGKRIGGAVARPSASVAAWLVVAPAFLAALVTRFYPWALQPTTDVPVALLGFSAIVALVSFARDSAMRSRLLERARSFWLPVGALLGVLVVALALSGNAAQEFWGYTNSERGLAQIGALVVVALFALADADAVKRVLVRIAPAFLALQVAVAVVVLALGLPGDGTLANSAYFAQVVLLLIPITIGPAQLLAETPSARGFWRGSAWRIALAWASVAVVGWAGSRTGLAVGVVLVVALTLLELREAGLGSEWRRWLGWGLGLGGAALVVLAAAVLASPLRVKYLTPFIGDRPQYWAATWASFLASPVIGHGPDSYWTQAVRFSALSGVTTVDGIGGDPHNALLGLLQIGGVLGVAAVAWLGWEVARSWRATGASAVWLGSAACAYLLTGLTEPFHLEVLPIFALVLGASLAAPRELAVPVALEPASRGVRWGVLALCSVLTAAVAVLGVASAVAGVPATPPRPAAERAQFAADLALFDPFLYYNASLRWGAVTDAASAGDVSAHDLAAITRAASLAPADPTYALEQARTEGTYGAPTDLVLGHFERALALWPTFAEAVQEHARYLVVAGQPAAARAAAVKLRGLVGDAGMPSDLRALLATTTPAP